MKNEYGETLDRNGYAVSLFDLYDGACYWCERRDRALQRHEIFHGAYREKSKAYGCWVNLCVACHMKLHHSDARIDKALKNYAQRIAMQHYGWSVDDFRQRFGKSYVEDDE